MAVVGTATVEIHAALDAVRDEISRGLTTALAGVNTDLRINIDTTDAKVKIDELQKKIDALNGRGPSITPHVDDAEARAKILELEAKLKELDGKKTKTNVEVDVDRGLSGLEKFGISLTGLGLTMTAFGNGTVDKWAAIGTAAAGAGGVIGGAFAALPGLAGIGGAALGTIMMGLDGIKQAASTIDTQFQDLKNQIGGAFFQSMQGGFQQLADVLFPSVTKGMQGVAGALGNVFQGIVGVVTSAQGLSSINTILSGTKDFINTMAPGIATFTQSFLQMASAGMPALQGLATVANQAFTQFNAMIQPLIAGGQFQAAISGLVGTVGALSNILNNAIGGLIQMAAQLLGPLNDALNALAPAIAPILSIFTSLGTSLLPVITEAIKLLVPIIQSLVPPFDEFMSKMGPSLMSAVQTLAPVVQQIATAFGQFLNAIVPLLGPAATTIQLFTAIGDVIGLLMPIVVVLVDAIDQIVKALAGALAPVIPVVVSAVKSLVGALAPVIPIIADLIVQVINLVAPLIGPLITAVVDLAVALMPLVAAFLKLAEAALKPLIPIVPLLADAFGKIVQALLPLIPPITQLVMSLIPPLSAIIAAMIPYWSSLINAVVTLVTALVPLIPPLLQLVNVLLPPLTAIISFLAPIIGSVLAGAVNVLATVLKFLIGILVDVITWISNAITWVSNLGNVTKFFSDLWHTVWGAIKDFFVSIWGDIQSFFTGIWNAISGWFTGAMHTLQNLWNTVWGAISDFFSSIWNGIKGFFTGIWNAIVSWFTTALNNFINNWKAIFQAVSDFFSMIWNGIKSFFTTIWNAIYSWFSGALNAFVSFFQGIWNGISSFFSNIWNAIKAAAAAIWNAISSFFTNAFNGFVSFFQGIWNGISSFFSGIWQGIENAASSVWNRISGFFSGAFNTFVGFFKGIWNDVSKFFSDIWNGISNTVKTVWDNIIGFIKSPINAVIGFVNTLIHGVNKVLGWVGLGPIGDIPTLAEGGVLGVPGLAAGGPLFQQVGGGFKTNGPKAIVGEGNPAYPEYVIPTDPAHRGRATMLMQSAAKDMHLMASGGVMHPTTPEGIPMLGLGDFLGSVWDNTGGRVVSGVANVAESIGNAVMAGIHDVEGLLAKGVNVVVDGIFHGVESLIPHGFFGDMAIGFLEKMRTGFESWIGTAADKKKATDAAAGGNSTTPASHSANVAAVQAVASTYGWGSGPEWDALVKVINRESGFNNVAQNPTSTAYGMFQFLNGTWGGYGVAKTSDPNLQAQAGLRYIKGRYGDPIGAWNHEVSAGWYDNGGWLAPGLTLAQNDTGQHEMIMPVDKLRQILREAQHEDYDSREDRWIHQVADFVHDSMIHPISTFAASAFQSKDPLAVPGGPSTVQALPSAPVIPHQPTTSAPIPVTMPKGDIGVAFRGALAELAPELSQAVSAGAATQVVQFGQALLSNPARMAAINQSVADALGVPVASMATRVQDMVSSALPTASAQGGNIDSTFGAAGHILATAQSTVSSNSSSTSSPITVHPGAFHVEVHGNADSVTVTQLQSALRDWNDELLHQVRGRR